MAGGWTAYVALNYEQAPCLDSAAHAVPEDAINRSRHDAELELGVSRSSCLLRSCPASRTRGRSARRREQVSPQSTASRSTSGQDYSASFRRAPSQPVAGGLRFWRGRRLRGAPVATAVDPGFRPRFFSVLPTLCSFRSR
jgi:hypothetical protein